MKKHEAKTNRLIGRRLRELRILEGLTLMQLAEALVVTFQSVQKYENGTNTITPWKLMRLAKTLDVPIAFFFGERDSPAQDDELRVGTLRLAEKLQWIERHRPEDFRNLCDSIDALTNGRK